jgi:hypothetical protein
VVLTPCDVATFVNVAVLVVVDGMTEMYVLRLLWVDV